MKVTELKKIIREEVKAAIREELQEMLTEAVSIASKPVNEAPVQRTQAPKQQPKASNLTFNAGAMDSMLQATAAAMTNDDYKNAVNMDSSMIKKPNYASTISNQMGLSGNEPGLDLSSLDFVQKAKSVLDASMEKDRARHGL